MIMTVFILACAALLMIIVPPPNLLIVPLEKNISIKKVPWTELIQQKDIQKVTSIEWSDFINQKPQKKLFPYILRNIPGLNSKFVDNSNSNCDSDSDRISCNSSPPPPLPHSILSGRQIPFWNPQYVEKHIPFLDQVYESNKTKRFEYNSKTFDGDDPIVKMVRMKTNNFLRTAIDPLPPHVYYSSPLSNTLWASSADLISKLKSFATFVDAAETCGFSRSEFTLDDINIWIGGVGVITVAHYDAEHNFYIQLFGSKEFVLLSPSYLHALYLHSNLSPNARQSSLDFDHIDPAQYPAFQLQDQGTIYLVELKAGDVLYMPPYWFHRVKSTEFSMSLNVWYGSDLRQISIDAEQVALPFEEEWALPLRLSAVAWYIVLVIEAAALGPAWRFLNTLLLSRYINQIVDTIHVTNNDPMNSILNDLDLYDDEIGDVGVEAIIEGIKWSLGKDTKSTILPPNWSCWVKNDVTDEIDIEKMELRSSKVGLKFSQLQDISIRTLYLENYIENLVAWGTNPYKTTDDFQTTNARYLQEIMQICHRKKTS